MIGKTISHYKILEKLGEGGMGVVYKAQDTVLDRTVELKFLTKGLTSDDEAKTRFIHEAKAASALDHPNIATVYEIGEVGGESFISMAYVDGGSLKEVVEKGPPSMEKVLDIAIQVAEGLSAAHRKGIVHRDIKSDNIMLSREGLAKILDFGLAKLKGLPKTTKEGSTLGTISYMSPEQARGLEVDHRSDIFSFGVVMYELITGELPFQGEYEPAVIYSIINETPKPVGELRADLPGEMERIVCRALEKNPGDRYQSMEEMAFNLKSLRDRSVSMKPSGTTSAGSGRGIRSRALITAAALLVIAVGLIAGIKIQIGRQPQAEASEDCLAVMYFENLTDREDPERLGEIVTNLLITDLSESRYVRADYIRFLCGNGKVKEAREILKEMEKDLVERDLFTTISYWSAASLIERAEGDTETAAVDAQKAYEKGPLYGFEDRFLLGRGLLEAGKLGEAVEELEKELSTYSKTRAYAAVSAVRARYLLGLAYERSGWRDKAITQYEEFLDIWKDADPGIPEIEDAKERLERLKSRS